MRTLYFEGAGWEHATDGWTDVPNCRIRTAFTNDKGQKIYLEILGRQRVKEDKKRDNMPAGDAIGWVDFAHYITDDPDIDDCNASHIYYNDGQPVERTRPIKYTYSGIKEFINNTFCCSFTDVVVLNDLTGYRVFKDGGQAGTFDYYNYGDEFQYDEVKTKRRLAKRDELSAYFKQFMKYDNTSYWVADNGDLMVKINTYEKDFKRMKFKERQFQVAID